MFNVSNNSDMYSIHNEKNTINEYETRDRNEGSTFLKEGFAFSDYIASLNPKNLLTSDEGVTLFSGLHPLIFFRFIQAGGNLMTLMTVSKAIYKIAQSRQLWIPIAKMIRPLFDDKSYLFDKKGDDALPFVKGSIEDIDSVWQVLADTIEVEIDPQERENFIQIPKNFSSWFKEHKETLRSLEVLKLNNLYLKYLPSEIGEFTNLTKLDLSFNQLEFLPDSIENLVNLVELNLSENLLELLPDSIGNLINLEWLIIANNRLKSLPHSTTYLDALVKLDLSNNPLESLPESMDQLIRLTYLRISLKNLVINPVCIGRLPDLVTLDLSWSEIESVPNWVGQLSELRSLNLSHNRLKSLPKSIENLNHLHTLNLSHNEFNSLPDWIVNLKLHKLDLSNNCLEAPLPNGIDGESLSWLILTGNFALEEDSWALDDSEDFEYLSE